MDARGAAGAARGVPERDVYGISADRIGALGASSGAHLASMLATLDGKGKPEAIDLVDRESAKVQSVVALYPGIDLAQIDTPIGLSALPLATGILKPPPRNVAATALAAKQLRAVSPVTYGTPDDPPLLLIHGDSDRIVPFQQSEIMEAALRQARIAVKLVRVAGGDHGTGAVGWDKVDWPDLTFEWFETHLRGTAPLSAARAG